MTWFIVLLIIGYLVWRFTSPRKPSSWTGDLVVTKAAPEPDTQSLDNPSWEEPFDLFLPSHPRPIQATLRLSYADATGASTERHVDVKECDTTNPSGYLIGFCHLRNAVRTFRMDRVKRAIDAESGEIIDDLCQFAAKKYAESPVAALDALLKDSADALRALFYIGKADGRFTAKEKQIFLAYCQQAAGDARITMAQVDRACFDMPIPSMQAFRLICGRLSKLDATLKAVIIAAAEQMIATEKRVSPEEEAALAYLKQRLAESPPA